MPPMRPITANEVQIARQRLGPQAQNLSDEDIKVFLQKNRQKQYWEARNGVAAQGFAAKAANQGQIPQNSAQRPPMNPPAPQTAPGQANRPTQTPKPTPSKPQAPAANKNTRPSNAKQAQKPSLKRPSSDDVVENQTPTNQPTSQPQTNVPNPQVGNRPRMPQYTREQLAAMTAPQREQFEAHMRRQQAQTKQPITKSSADEAWNRLPENIKQIYIELVRNAPKIEPVSMTQEQRTSMAQQLRESTDMLSRMDALVQFWARAPGHEKSVHALLNMVS
jgi:hypothetical protein